MFAPGLHGCCAPQEVDWTRPTAFILGNEKFGISDEAVALADATAIIPMSGFVESFNISVAAALIMYEAQQQRIRKQVRLRNTIFVRLITFQLRRTFHCLGKCQRHGTAAGTLHR